MFLDWKWKKKTFEVENFLVLVHFAMFLVCSILDYFCGS